MSICLRLNIPTSPCKTLTLRAQAFVEDQDVKNTNIIMHHLLSAAEKEKYGNKKKRHHMVHATPQVVGLPPAEGLSVIYSREADPGTWVIKTHEEWKAIYIGILSTGADKAFVNIPWMEEGIMHHSGGSAQVEE